MTNISSRLPATLLLALLFHGQCLLGQPEILEWISEVKTLFTQDDGEWIWFHPRACAFPDPKGKSRPTAILTLQKHLQESDFYSGLSYSLTEDGGKTWSAPTAPRELAWRTEPGEVIVGVCDVTPGWHPASEKVLAIGVKVRYKDGIQLVDQPGSHDLAYAAFDPATRTWTDWRTLEFDPRPDKFFMIAPGCSQWLAEPDGTLLIPVYHREKDWEANRSTVLRCSFDGTEMRLLEQGEELTLEVERGFVEPSLAKLGDRYFLTLRNDQAGYVTSGTDGLHWDPVRPWRFNDGQELGSYNTQQHWLVHDPGLFLVYTRKGAGNDHIFRHRAPLFLAQVDPDKWEVIRETEKILIPERGAQMGNFGANPFRPEESWVTVSEGMWGEARQRGAEGATFLARILWDRPNLTVGD